MPHLVFDGCSLRLYDQNKVLLKQWKARAGAPFSNSKDQSKKNKGPLPEGTYTVRWDQAVFFNQSPTLKSNLSWFLKHIAWGDLAIPLEPDPANKMYGRNAFMIHGGGRLYRIKIV